MPSVISPRVTPQERPSSPCDCSPAQRNSSLCGLGVASAPLRAASRIRGQNLMQIVDRDGATCLMPTPSGRGSGWVAAPSSRVSAALPRAPSYPPKTTRPHHLRWSWCCRPRKHALHLLPGFGIIAHTPQLPERTVSQWPGSQPERECEPSDHQEQRSGVTEGAHGHSLRRGEPSWDQLTDRCRASAPLGGRRALMTTR